MTEQKVKKVILFEDKDSCCGCGACENICPKQAITMKEDEFGFTYPKIDYSICVGCGKCKEVCHYKNESLLQSPKEVFASNSINNELLSKSASGGVFAVLAEHILLNSGVVFGAAFVQKDGTLELKHICVDNKDDLYKLQGSKYVQSSIEKSYQEVEKNLINDIPVLFSGTPCQIVGLKSYLGKDYDLLTTVDIICHGVPNERFFKDYLSAIVKKNGSNIVDFKFRDKEKGWGLTAKLIYEDSKGKMYKKSLPFKISSYYDMFINCETYRENCYTCPYAQQSRIGDITLGDYWGIKEEHPELMKKAGGPFNEEKGISCVLVNTEKGKLMINRVSKNLQLSHSSIEKVSKENHQLQKPSIKPVSRQQILDLYKAKGYEAVEKQFNKRLGIKKYYYILKNAIPRPIKSIIKRFLRN